MSNCGDPFDVVNEVISAVSKIGWRIAPLAEKPDLVASVRRLMRRGGGSDLDAVIEFEEIIVEAVTALGDNPRGLAAQLLLGLHTDTRGRLRKHRRAAAADAMALVPESFVRHHEKAVIADIAAALYKLTAYEKGGHAS